MMTDIARFQVDVVTGDANASMYKAFNTQSTYSIGDSSLHKMMHAMGRFINYWGGGWPNYVDIQMVSSNTTEDLKDLTEFYQIPPHQRIGEAPGVDCIVTYFISWAHSARIRSFRNDYGFEYDPQTGNYDAMAPDEFEAKTNEIVEGRGAKDFVITVTNYYMQFDNDLMLLGSTDHDWHTPLQSVIRNGRGLSTVRKRSAQATAQRNAKKRSQRSGVS